MQIAYRNTAKVGGGLTPNEGFASSLFRGPRPGVGLPARASEPSEQPIPAVPSGVAASRSHRWIVERSGSDTAELALLEWLKVAQTASLLRLRYTPSHQVERGVVQIVVSQ